MPTDESFQTDRNTSSDVLKNKAEQGDPQAQYELAICHIQGDGVAKDIEEASKWLCKAAEQGHKQAQRILLNNYRDIAEQGNADAQFGLGRAYHRGTDIAQNKAEAVKWIRKAAEQGHAEAQFFLSCLYCAGDGVEENVVEMAKWLKKAALRGHERAIKVLNDMEANVTAAHVPIQEAAEQGDVEAQYELGICYGNGDGVEKDYAKAVYWWRHAAERGHAKAQYNLGIFYYQGMGVEKNEEEGLKWLRKAAEQGEQWAIQMLHSIETGYNDPAQEAERCRVAAEDGNPVAQFALGGLYYNGDGVEQDASEAVKWYRKAAEQGYAKAQVALGLLYAQGIGVDADNEEAFKWFREAAKQGDTVALEILGKSDVEA
jgi:TPR repeat protein